MSWATVYLRLRRGLFEKTACLMNSAGIGNFPDWNANHPNGTIQAERDTPKFHEANQRLFVCPDSDSTEFPKQAPGFFCVATVANELRIERGRSQKIRPEAHYGLGIGYIGRLHHSWWKRGSISRRYAHCRQPGIKRRAKFQFPCGCLLSPIPTSRSVLTSTTWLKIPPT